MLLDATVGGATANSFVTVARANTLLEGRLSTEPWFGIAGAQETEVVSMATRTTALIWATTLLATQVRWYGTPTTLTQALPLPMTGLVDRLGRPVLATTIPADIELATALYALALLRDESAGALGSAEAMLQSKKIGDTTLVFRAQSEVLRASPIHGIPAEVRALLRPYGLMAGGINVPLVRV